MAPTLRGIKALPSATPTHQSQDSHQPEKKVAPGAKTTMTSRWLFLVGFVMLLACGIAAGTLFFKASQLDTNLPEYTLSKRDQARLDNMSFTELIQVWEVMRNVEMDEWQEHPGLTNRRTAQNQKLAGGICAGVAGLGLLLMIGSQFLRNRAGP